MDKKNQIKLLAEMAESLNQAEGGAGQLIHQLGHPGFIMIRECVALVKEGVVKIASDVLKPVQHAAGSGSIII